MSWSESQESLPSGWVWTTVADVADALLGKMLDSKKQSGQHPMRYLRNINVRWHSVDTNDLLTMDVAPDQRDRYTVRGGDLLVCEGGEPGRCAIVPESAEGLAFQKALHRIRPAQGVDAHYLGYAFEAMVRLGHLDGQTTGSTIRHLPLERLRRLPLPLPPTGEQIRIARALDEHLSLIGLAQGDLGKLRLRVHRLTDAVLNGVVRRAVADVDELTPTGEVSSITGGIQKQPKRYPTEENAGVPFLRVANVGRRTLDLDDVHRILVSEAELHRVLLRTGDLLVVEGNGSPDQIGRAALWRGVIADCTHQNHLIRVRPGHDVLPDYLELVWNAPTTVARLKEVASTTSGLYTLSTKKVAAVPIPVPGLEVQHALVATARAELELAEKAQRDLAAISRPLEATRRSVLRAAFKGELAPADSTDESAKILLERIEEERASRAGVRTARKRTVRKPRSAGSPHTEEIPK